MADQPVDPISGVAALDEPTRRRLYDYVARSREPVGRDEASEVVGVSRSTAAFHLDRLADEGLLDVVHRRLSGRTGPGAGRPSKLYLRAAGLDIEVSLPQRRYELAGEVLAAAVDEAQAAGRPIAEAVADCAAQVGRRMGESAGAQDPLAVLASHGFEPRIDEGVVTLRNCPFHNLAQKHPDLVCGMNLSLIDGLLAGMECATHAASLQPGPDRCCVVLEPS